MTTNRRLARLLVPAALTAATAIPLATAPPAYADQVHCTTVPVNEDWSGTCYRIPNDGDSGGVSGDAYVRSNRAADFARIQFKAKGENFYLKTKYEDASFWAYYYYDGEWLPFFTRVQLDADESQTINKTLSEGRRVDIMACVRAGCARINTLRS
ncbi:hypothetical protein ACFW4X_15630 [Streptomyces smyrnaeus]|uniref:hypothetical protein n=1 Tax=Streptomyces smyrnaeus TaxID=1387713 RepID=UPI0036AD60EC